MSYKLDTVTMEDVKESYKNYPFALIYMMSDLVFAKTEELDNILWDECLEARFFGKNGELHMFRNDGIVTCRRIEEDGEVEGEVLTDKYKLDNRFQKYGKGVVVKRYLKYDDDGQAYVGLTRLAEIV